jgi:hypothetical protein
MIKYEKLIPYNGEIIRFQFKPKRNPYVGQDQIGANKFIINKESTKPSMDYRRLATEKCGEVLLIFRKQ